MAHTYSKRGASTSAAVVGGKSNDGADAATSKDEDYSPNHVVYKKVGCSVRTCALAFPYDDTCGLDIARSLAIGLRLVLA